MTTIQMHPPGAGKTTTVVNGRAYTATPGTPIAVPDFDAFELEANGWVVTAAGGTGTTAQRPASPAVNTQYHDTTVGAIVKWDGKAWRNVLTGAAV
jgi:hypothetical protein